MSEKYIADIGTKQLLRTSDLQLAKKTADGYDPAISVQVVRVSDLKIVYHRHGSELSSSSETRKVLDAAIRARS